IVYRNIDVVDMHENQVDYQGVFAILAGDNNIVKNITFEDIRIENFRKGRLIDIRIPWNKKYCAAPGSCIENVLFKDIYYNGDRSELSLIIGYDETRKIKGVTFDNLVINGEHIYDKMPGKPGWYKTADMAPMFIGEHVEDVVFK
ncbi:MAG: endo-polygalacturonase, partial [Muribaculaceae bacterium]|nr:endo-polygalacturonase [Muribaculaceae bacterium]